MITDSHLHVWSLKRGDYHWLSQQLGCLYADHGLPELYGTFKKNKIKQVILVQAAATIAETEFLLEQANQHKALVSGVIGWIDFDASEVLQQLATLAVNPLLCGVRLMLQDISPDDWILQDCYATIFSQLADKKLVFDVLVRQEQLSVANKLVRLYPNVTMVIDHCGKPNLDRHECDMWLAELTELAACNNVFIKLSGLPAQSSHSFNSQNAFYYVQQVFALFGPNRVIWGSDWPVVKLGSDYQHWLQFCQQACLKLGFNQEQQQQIFHQNACRVYGITTHLGIQT